MRDAKHHDQKETKPTLLELLLRLEGDIQRRSKPHERMGNTHVDDSTGLDDEPEAGRSSPREETAVRDEGEERAGEE